MVKLICVNDRWGEINSPLGFALTIGKMYEGEYQYDGWSVRNDNGNVAWYRRAHFMLVEDYRNKRLEDLLGG